MHYSAIIIGGSAGGLYALTAMLERLPVDYPIPIIIIQHRANDHLELLEEVLQYKCTIRIKQADEKECIRPGTVYVAPPGYHLLIESNMTFSLSNEMLVKYSMPSIDVSFETAATVYREKLVGIILTGASDDGTDGVKIIKAHNGLTIAQNPKEAPFPFMPKSAIETKCVDFIWTIEQIGKFLIDLA